MKKLLLALVMFCGGLAMAQQQDFRYWCTPIHSSATVAITTQVSTGACTTNITTPNTAVDYPQVSGAGYDSTVVVGSGHITHLRVRVLDTNGGLDLCSDSVNSVAVSDGDRVGAYYVTSTGVLTIYIGSTATALTCTVPNLIFPGVVASALQVDFFKRS